VREKGLRKSPKGYYYHSVATSVRRLGQFKHSQKSIDALKKGGFITDADLPTF
jgi:hypothetical protein